MTTPSFASDQIDWEAAAAVTGLPVFPVKITFDESAGKWVKKPLTDKWQEAGFYRRGVYDWSRANGYGILMGNGYYALDLDGYKPGCGAEAWFRERPRLSWETRTHRTVSGGLHKIYATRSGQEDLPTRANIVPGLDGRGKGGFIAFGEGYSIDIDAAPHLLPAEVGDEIYEGAGGTGGRVIGEREMVQGYRPPEPKDASRKLRLALASGPRLLRQRWKGDTAGLRDRSRSALDHSVARLLGLTGMTEDQIVWALLEKFEHGAARHKGAGHVALRAAARSALKSIAQVEAEKAMTGDFKQPELSDEEEEHMRRLLGLPE